MAFPPMDMPDGKSSDMPMPKGKKAKDGKAHSKMGSHMKAAKKGKRKMPSMTMKDLKG